MHIRVTGQQGCQEHTMGKGQFLQQMMLGKLDIHMQKNEIGSLSYTRHKVNWKLIKGLNVRPETVKLLEENMREHLHHIDLGNDFMDMTPKTLATKVKIDK